VYQLPLLLSFFTINIIIIIIYCHNPECNMVPGIAK
jgi:hypothetical protein